MASAVCLSTKWTRPTALAAVVASSLWVSPSSALSAAEEEALGQKTVETWQQAKQLMTAGKYSEAEAQLAALSTLLHSKVDANHQWRISTDDMLAMVRQMKGVNEKASTQARSTAQSADGKTIRQLPQAEYEASVAAKKEQQEGRDLLSQGKYAEGAAKIDHSLQTLEFTLGPDDQTNVVNRQLLLQIYREILQQPQKAQAVLERESTARKSYAAKLNNESAQSVAMRQMADAMTAFSVQDYEKAIQLFEAALPELQRIFANKAEVLVPAQVILAQLYATSLKYDKSEALFRQIIAEVEKQYGKDSELLIDPLQGLSSVLLSSHGAPAALIYSERQVELLKKYQPNSPRYSEALLSRGELRLYSNQIPQALEDFSAVQALMQNQASSPRNVVRLLEAMRTVFLFLGKKEAADDAQKKLCDFGRSSTEPAIKQSTASACVDQATSGGDWSRAERSLELQIQAQRIKEGKRASLQLLQALHKLAVIKHQLKKDDEALKLMQEALHAEEQTIQLELSTGSDAQKREKFHKYQQSLYRIMTLGGAETGASPANLLAFQTLLRRKGRVLDAEADAARAARLMVSPEEKQLYARQREVRALTTGLILKGESSGDGTAPYQESLARLESEDAQLTQLLNQKSEAYRSLHQEVTVAGVQAKLPADAALIEYSFYIRNDPQSGLPTEIRVAAFVLTQERGAQAFDLGNAAPIYAATQQLRTAMVGKKPIEKPASSLHQLLIQPLLPALGAQNKRLLIAPDDVLNLIPFAALKNSKKQYLLEQFEINYLSSGRDLLNLNALRPAQNPALVIGNPAFDAGVSGAKGQRSGDLRDVNFPALPGTAEEVKRVTETLKGAQLFTGEQASKQTLEARPAPAVLHIATHGFFLNIDDTAASAETRGFTIENDTPMEAKGPSSRAENPLIRSGLAFAGANQTNSAAGILSALEAATLNLDGTKLVVLSACETAVGATDPGEGVYGLRRALVVAGSESQLMSLWKVDDLATRDLMIQFYEKLQAGKSRGDAIRQAQLTMLKSKKHQHPYYWAAFIPSGNFNAMSFEVAPQVGASNTNTTGSQSPQKSPWIMSASGTKFMWGARVVHIGNLLNQPDRIGSTAVFRGEISLISDSDPLVETGFAFHDALILEAEFGARLSKAYRYQDDHKESAFAYGYFAAYEFGLGFRTQGIGLMAGLRPSYNGYRVGSVSHAGLQLPGFALLEMRPGNQLISLRGWWGSPFIDQQVLGASLDIDINETYLLRFTGEQSKMKTKVGGLEQHDERVDAGHQVANNFTFSVGSYFE